MMYAFQDMEYDRQNFLSFWAIFCQFISLTTWKIKFSKNEKSDCFLRYGATDRQSFFLILDHFFPFYQPHRPTPCNPTTSQKSKILKKWETPGDIIILYKCTKIMIICYTVPKIWRVTDVIVIFYFWLFLGAPPKNISNPNKWVWQSFVPQLFHSKFFCNLSNCNPSRYLALHLTGALVLWYQWSMIVISFNNFIQNRTTGWEVFLMQYLSSEINPFILDVRVGCFSKLFITLEI